MEDHAQVKMDDQPCACWCGKSHPWYIAHWRPQVLVIDAAGKARLLPAGPDRKKP